MCLVYVCFRRKIKNNNSMGVTTWSRFLFRIFVVRLCILFQFPGVIIHISLPINSIDWCWWYREMCIFLVHIREFLGMIDHNDWRSFVVLDSCFQMGKMNIEVNILYDPWLHFSSEKCDHFLQNLQQEQDNEVLHYALCRRRLRHFQILDHVE